MLTWFIKTKKIARPRRRSMPSRRFNTGGMAGGCSEGTDLLCGREWGEVREETFLCAKTCCWCALCLRWTGEERFLRSASVEMTECCSQGGGRRAGASRNDGVVEMSSSVEMTGSPLWCGA